jgi:hypothetical protein
MTETTTQAPVQTEPTQTDRVVDDLGIPDTFHATIGGKVEFAALFRVYNEELAEYDRDLATYRKEGTSSAIVLRCVNGVYDLWFAFEITNIADFVNKEYFNNRRHSALAMIAPTETSIADALFRLMFEAARSGEFDTPASVDIPLAITTICPLKYLPNLLYTKAAIVTLSEKAERLDQEHNRYKYRLFALVDNGDVVDFTHEGFNSTFDLIEAIVKVKIEPQVQAFVVFKTPITALSALDWLIKSTTAPIDISKTNEQVQPDRTVSTDRTVGERSGQLEPIGQIDRMNRELLRVGVQFTNYNFERLINGHWKYTSPFDLMASEIKAAIQTYGDENNHSAALVQIVPNNPHYMFPVRRQDLMAPHVKALLRSQKNPDLYIKRQETVYGSMLVMWRGFIVGAVPESLVDKIDIEAGTTLTVKRHHWSTPDGDLSISL